MAAPAAGGDGLPMTPATTKALSLLEQWRRSTAQDRTANDNIAFVMDVLKRYAEPYEVLIVASKVPLPAPGQGDADGKEQKMNRVARRIADAYAMDALARARDAANGDGRRESDRREALKRVEEQRTEAAANLAVLGAALLVKDGDSMSDDEKGAVPLAIGRLAGDDARGVGSRQAWRQLEAAITERYNNPRGGGGGGRAAAGGGTEDKVAQDTRLRADGLAASRLQMDVEGMRGDLGMRMLELEMKSRERVENERARMLEYTEKFIDMPVLGIARAADFMHKYAESSIKVAASALYLAAYGADDQKSSGADASAAQVTRILSVIARRLADGDEFPRELLTLSEEKADAHLEYARGYVLSTEEVYAVSILLLIGKLAKGNDVRVAQDQLEMDVRRLAGHMVKTWARAQQDAVAKAHADVYQAIVADTAIGEAKVAGDPRAADGLKAMRGPRIVSDTPGRTAAEYDAMYKAAVAGNANAPNPLSHTYVTQDEAFARLRDFLRQTEPSSFAEGRSVWVGPRLRDLVRKAWDTVLNSESVARTARGRMEKVAILAERVSVAMNQLAPAGDKQAIQSFLGSAAVGNGKGDIAVRLMELCENRSLARVVLASSEGLRKEMVAKINQLRRVNERDAALMRHLAADWKPDEIGALGVVCTGSDLFSSHEAVSAVLIALLAEFPTKPPDKAADMAAEAARKWIATVEDGAAVQSKALQQLIGDARFEEAMVKLSVEANKTASTAMQAVERASEVFAAIRVALRAAVVRDATMNKWTGAADAALSSIAGAHQDLDKLRADLVGTVAQTKRSYTATTPGKPLLDTVTGSTSMRAVMASLADRAEDMRRRIEDGTKAALANESSHAAVLKQALGMVADGFAKERNLEPYRAALRDAAAALRVSNSYVISMASIVDSMMRDADLRSHLATPVLDAIGHETAKTDSSVLFERTVGALATQAILLRARNLAQREARGYDDDDDGKGKGERDELGVELDKRLRDVLLAPGMSAHLSPTEEKGLGVAMNDTAVFKPTWEAIERHSYNEVLAEIRGILLEWDNIIALVDIARANGADIQAGDALGGVAGPFIIPDNKTGIDGDHKAHDYHSTTFFEHAFIGPSGGDPKQGEVIGLFPVVVVDGADEKDATAELRRCMDALRSHIDMGGSFYNRVPMYTGGDEETRWYGVRRRMEAVIMSAVFGVQLPAVAAEPDVDGGRDRGARLPVPVKWGDRPLSTDKARKDLLAALRRSLSEFAHMSRRATARVEARMDGSVIVERDSSFVVEDAMQRMITQARADLDAAMVEERKKSQLIVVETSRYCLSRVLELQQSLVHMDNHLHKNAADPFAYYLRRVAFRMDEAVLAIIARHTDATSLKEMTAATMGTKRSEDVMRYIVPDATLRAAVADLTRDAAAAADARGRMDGQWLSADDAMQRLLEANVPVGMGGMRPANRGQGWLGRISEYASVVASVVSDDRAARVFNNDMFFIANEQIYVRTRSQRTGSSTDTGARRITDASGVGAGSGGGAAGNDGGVAFDENEGVLELRRLLVRLMGDEAGAGPDDVWAACTVLLSTVLFGQTVSAVMYLDSAWQALSEDSSRATDAIRPLEMAKLRPLLRGLTHEKILAKALQRRDGLVLLAHHVGLRMVLAADNARDTADSDDGGNGKVLQLSDRLRPQMIARATTATHNLMRWFTRPETWSRT